MSRMTDYAARLYNGEVSYDFVGRIKRWYLISAIFLVIAVASLLIRGLNLGIEFRGGAEFGLTNPTCTVEQARDAANAVTGGQAIVTQTSAGTIRVQTEPVDPATSQEVGRALAQACGISEDGVKVQLVGPTWGGEITSKALQGLVVFLVLLMIFLSLYFEWRMAVAAIVALIHDLAITIGIYALTGLEVTPATVIGFLTILGFSLYDTVVVFDKVKENTKGITGQSRQTYAEAANLALNQTLVRSINTSVVALLPIVAIIVVGAGLLGAGTLLDLAVAMAVGTAVGTYSSIFIATPVLVQLKQREPEVQALEKRVLARRSGQASSVRGRKAVAGGTGQGGTAVDVLDDVDDVDDAPAAASGSPAAAATKPTGAAGTRPASGGASSAGGPGGRSQPKRKPRSQRPGGRKR